MASTTINQKEYLKKYLGIGKSSGDKKKKKKRDKNTETRFKIIDDDIDLALSQEIQEDIAASNEDAPQIVAVIDERPPSLRIDENTKNKLWKPIGDTTESSTNVGLKINSFQLKKYKGNESEAIESKLKSLVDNRSKSKVYTIISKDYSPPRSKNKNISDSLISKESLSKYKIKNEDLSPPRNKPEIDLTPSANNYKSVSPVRKKEYSSDERKSDISPPRRKSDKLSPPRQKTDDLSPPRKKFKDLSPVRKKDYSPSKRRHEDLSPPRRKQDSSPPRKENKSSSFSKSRRDDLSPPRRKHKEDKSPVEKYTYEDIAKKIKKEKSVSPRRYNLDRAPKDHSPRGKTKDDFPIKLKREKSESPSRKPDRDLSPPRRHKNIDLSPPRRGIKREQSESSPRQRISRWSNKSPESSKRRSKTPEKAQKTLSGKKAGLQNAQDLVQEMTALREREEETFKRMSEEVSGKNAATVVRGQKTKDPEVEAELLKKQKDIKEKYDRWGKGLKQVQNESEKMIEQLHEMNKPLARYADDEDLERYLKEQEREGDPMLAYIRKKKKKKAVEAGIPEKPMYMGEFLPNRFSIRPGYRWDGVDRSTGYEKKWFETHNAKRAQQEEAFRWSTEDM